jgi:N6-L-threonylcarbamoyladenine synthase
LPPSIRHKVNSHLALISQAHKILPISNIIVEVGQFDPSKLGDFNSKKGFLNVREYVLFRDSHKCQKCFGKSGDPILNVHHIESRRTGGNSPGNLITLCKTCHDEVHRQGLEKIFKRVESTKDCTQMNIIGKFLIEKLQNMYKSVVKTFGYITKSDRIDKGLDKRHYNDAYCISRNLQAKSLDYYFYSKQVRCHNRKIHKAKILKGGKKRKNQGEYTVCGFRLFDKVIYRGIKCFIYGRRKRGYFLLRTLDYKKVGENCKVSEMELFTKRKSFLIEVRNK